MGNQKGFTLIELLVVVSIISFLAYAFVAPVMKGKSKAETQTTEIVDGYNSIIDDIGSVSKPSSNDNAKP